MFYLDQFGVKHINPEVLNTLSNLQFTDMMFFIASAYARRFSTCEEISQYLPSCASELRDVKYEELHRELCKCLGSSINNESYYLAPFSLKKRNCNNIYGLIFGTSHPLALEKFLDYCWKQDEKTGEANYTFSNEYGQKNLFGTTLTKKDKFVQDFLSFLATGEKTNIQVYEFMLRNGFVSSVARPILEKELNIGFRKVSLEGSGKVRKNAYYLNWKEVKSNKPKIMFQKL